MDAFDFSVPEKVVDGVGSSKLRRSDHFKADVAFFRVVDLHPASRPIAPGAPKVPHLDGMAVRLADVRHADFAARRVYVAVEGLGGEASQDFHIFAGGIISFADINSMRLWTMEPRLHYDLGWRPPPDRQGAMQNLVEQLLKCYPEGLTLLPSHDNFEQLSACLHLLQERSMVARGESGSWSFTQDARDSMQLSNVLSGYRMVLQPRDGVPDTEKTSSSYCGLCDQMDGFA